MRIKARFICALSIVVLSCSLAFSAPVDNQTAYQVAQSIINNHIANYGTWGNSLNPTISDCSEIFYKGEKIAYNVRVQPSGQLLISGSDLLSPSLLYSPTSTFDPDRVKTPGSLESWIIPEIYTAYVKFEKPNRLKTAATVRGYSNSKVAVAWQNFTSPHASTLRMLTRFVAAGPVLTTSWGQSSPYNDQCPILDGQPTLVGCVATAWSQLLNYWEWPDQGEGTQSYYWTNGGQTLTETFDTRYDWDNMPDQLDAQSTQVQINAVAKLCHDVGIAAEMNYGVSSSGSNAYADAYLPRFFKYKNTATLYDRSQYDAASWMELIKPEFQASPPRPIAYSIFGVDGGGHEVIIDGYQEGFTDKIHINFGWEGSYNGYYDVTQNFEAGGYTWDSTFQQIVTHIEPDRGEPSDPTWSEDLPDEFYTFLILTDESKNFTLPSQCYVQVYGSSGSNNITLAPGARAILSNFVNTNTIHFQEPTSNFTISRSGSTVLLKSSISRTQLKIPATAFTQTLMFTNGDLPLAIINGRVTLGEQIVTSTAATVDDPAN